jgi:hypothetical protein
MADGPAGKGIRWLGRVRGNGPLRAASRPDAAEVLSLCGRQSPKSIAMPSANLHLIIWLVLEICG